MNPFSRVLSGYAAPPSDPAQMVLHSMLGVLESYWAEDNSIVTPSPNAHRDVITYLGNRFGERAPVVNYAKTLWQARLSR